MIDGCANIKTIFMKPISLSLTLVSLSISLSVNLMAQTPAPTTPAQTPGPTAPAPQVGKAAAAAAAAAAANAVALPPSTMDTKLKWLAYRTVSPAVLLPLAIPAAFSIIRPPARMPREWHTGAGGFARQYGHYVAMNSTTYGTTFAVASLTGEDPRYHPSADKTFGKRLVHALGSAFVGYSDDGKQRPAFSLWAGTVAGGFVSKTYMPPGFNDTVHAYQNSLLQFGRLVGGNVTLEFRSEIRSAARKLHLGFLAR